MNNVILYLESFLANSMTSSLETGISVFLNSNCCTQNTIATIYNHL